MECNYELKNGCLRILVPRELDHHCATGLRQETELLIEAYHVRKLIFDFSQTEFMDSSGIGVLIGRCKSMNYSGGEVMAENIWNLIPGLSMRGLQGWLSPLFWRN